MRITIHETYEYEVDAESAERAVELFHEFVESGDETTGVSFNQNYLHTYNDKGEEI